LWSDEGVKLRATCKSFRFAAVLVGSALFWALPAKANTYDFDFTSSVYDIVGTFTTGAPIGNGYYDITSMSGTITGPNGALTTITGLASPYFAAPPNYLVSSNGLWYYDNAFSPTVPNLALGGPYFESNTGALYNLYMSAGLTYLSTNAFNGLYYDPGVAGTLAVTQTPLPPTWLMLLSGLAGLTVLSLRITTTKRMVG
jgi:hypothetical protein